MVLGARALWWRECRAAGAMARGAAVFAVAGALRWIRKSLACLIAPPLEPSRQMRPSSFNVAAAPAGPLGRRSGRSENPWRRRQPPSSRSAAARRRRLPAAGSGPTDPADCSAPSCPRPRPAALLCLGAAQAAHFNIGQGGLDGWTASDDAKYSGKFKVSADGLTVSNMPSRSAARGGSQRLSKLLRS